MTAAGSRTYRPKTDAGEGSMRAPEQGPIPSGVAVDVRVSEKAGDVVSPPPCKGLAGGRGAGR